MKLKKEIQAIKELNEQEKQAQAQKAAALAAVQSDHWELCSPHILPSY